MVNFEYNPNVYDAILGEPKAVFKKTILGQVTVELLDPFDLKNKTTIKHILRGEPGSPESVVKLYSDEEVKYFYIANRRLIETGLIAPANVENQPVEPEVKFYTDEEIEEMLKSRYFKKFEKFLNEYADTPAKIARIIEIAKRVDLTKSKINLIRAKAMELGISEVEL